MREPLNMPQRWCYRLVLGRDLRRVPCKQPVFRELGHGTTPDGKPITEWVCFDHSPNARRPKPAGR